MVAVVLTSSWRRPFYLLGRLFLGRINRVVLQTPLVFAVAVSDRYLEVIQELANCCPIGCCLIFYQSDSFCPIMLSYVGVAGKKPHNVVCVKTT